MNFTGKRKQRQRREARRTLSVFCLFLLFGVVVGKGLSNLELEKKDRLEHGVASGAPVEGQYL